MNDEVFNANDIKGLNPEYQEKFLKGVKRLAVDIRQEQQEDARESERARLWEQYRAEIEQARTKSERLTTRAAGFIATSTSGASPGVCTSTEPKRIWNPDTPGRVPSGARISEG